MMSDEKDYLAKEFRIQILDETSRDSLIIALINNGYSVALQQSKKALYVKLANYYFKE